MQNGNGHQNGNGRRSFSKLDQEWVVDIPHLLDVQIRSFEKFLQHHTLADQRDNVGLQEVFNTAFPITDNRNLYALEFVSYSVGEPKYSVDECQERDLTFSAPLKARDLKPSTARKPRFSPALKPPPGAPRSPRS